MKKCILGSLLALFCSCSSHSNFDVASSLNYCEEQTLESLAVLNDTTRMPRNILSGEEQKQWSCTSIYDWTSGFWPGILWYIYEYTRDDEIRKQAERYSSALFPVVDRKADNHDLGFMMFCSSGNAYRRAKIQRNIASFSRFASHFI